MNEYSTLARLILESRLPEPLLPPGNEPPLPTRESSSLPPEQQLVHLLVTLPESEQTTVQLTKRLFGTNTAANRAALTKLLGRVRPKLLNNLYFLDHSNERYKRSRRYEAEVLDLLHKGHLLRLAGELQLMESFMQRALREARAGGFTAEALQASAALRSLYAARGVAATDHYLRLDGEAQYLQRQAAAEFAAERTYQRLLFGIVHQPAEKMAMIAELPAFIADVDQDRQVYPESFVLFEVLYKTRMMLAEIEEHYHEIVALTLAASQQVQVGAINERRFDIRYNEFWTLYAALRSGQVQQALHLAATYAKDFHPTSTNWFYFYRHWLLAALYAQDYAQAQHLLEVVKRNPTMSKLAAYQQEQWLVLEAYVGYTESAPGPHVRAHLKHLASSGYASQLVPKIRRNKTVDNVHILLFRLMYQLREGDAEHAPALSESLRKYFRRHLRGPEHERTHLFLRLLRLAAAALETHAVGQLRTKAERLRLKLAATTLPGTAELELIPLEHLWELTLQGMEQAAGHPHGPRRSRSRRPRATVAG